MLSNSSISPVLIWLKGHGLNLNGQPVRTVKIVAIDAYTKHIQWHCKYGM